MRRFPFCKLQGPSRQWLTLAAIISLAIGSDSNAAIQIADLYNTGQDPSHVLLGNNVPDPNYALVSVPTGSVGLPAGIIGADITVDDTAFPLRDFFNPSLPGPWIMNMTPDSRWIGYSEVDPTGVPTMVDIAAPVGTYYWETTFSLPNNAILSSVTVGGIWASDNFGGPIYLNGIPTGNFSPSLNAFSSFTLLPGSPFQPGLNTLTFPVNNDFGPSGLQVKMQGVFDAVPEATSIVCWGLFTVGGVLLVSFRYRVR